MSVFQDVAVVVVASRPGASGLLREAPEPALDPG